MREVRNCIECGGSGGISPSRWMFRLALPFLLALPGFIATIACFLDGPRDSVAKGVVSACIYLGPFLIALIAEGERSLRRDIRGLRDFASWMFEGESPRCPRCEGSGTELVHPGPPSPSEAWLRVIGVALGMFVALILLTSVSWLR